MYEPLAPSTLATWGTKKQRAVFSKREGGEVRRARSSSTSEPTPGCRWATSGDRGDRARRARANGVPLAEAEALLERIVLSLSAPGDLVLDPYAGSGTTLASRRGRGGASSASTRSDLAIETICARFSDAEPPRFADLQVTRND